MKPNLSIVIPAYNEAKNFRDDLLEPAVKFLRTQKYSWEVIFVNDGSTDDTEELLKKFCQRHKGYAVLTISHGGKAAAVTAGMLAAAGRVVLFTDFDQSTPLYQVTKFIEAHKKGFDVVVGDRHIFTMKNKLFRRFRSWVLVTLVQILLIPGIRDSQCGFKSFTNQAAKKIFSHLKVTNSGKIAGAYMGAFDTEVLFLAKKYRYQIAQVHVDWKAVEGERLNPILDPIKILLEIFRVKIFDLLGRYNHY